MKYYLPFSYGLATRAKTPLDKLSFLILFPLPLFLFCRCGVLRFLFGFSAVYCIYELGYLYNDFVTVKREKFPNYRMDPEEYRQLLPKVPFLALSRAGYALAFWLLSGSKAPGLGALWALLGLFLLHNTVRSRWNILTYFLLCSCKYLAVAALAGSVLWGLGFLPAFVLPRTLEHAAKPKYAIPFLQGLDTHSFRAYYYLFYCALTTFFALGSSYHLLGLWYFLYRAAALGYIKRTRKSAFS